MQTIPDHPVIQNCERTGWPDGKEPARPVCPVCGNECETVYKGLFDVIEGCDVCLRAEDAWEESECFPEREA